MFFFYHESCSDDKTTSKFDNRQKVTKTMFQSRIEDSGPINYFRSKSFQKDEMRFLQKFFEKKFALGKKTTRTFFEEKTEFDVDEIYRDKKLPVCYSPQ